jgi:hypothetical protein
MSDAQDKKYLDRLEELTFNPPKDKKNKFLAFEQHYEWEQLHDKMETLHPEWTCEVCVKRKLSKKDSFEFFECKIHGQKGCKQCSEEK